MACALLVGLISCDIDNPTEGLKVLFNLVPLGSLVAVDFYDAATAEQIDGVDISVEVTGPDAGKIVDLLDEADTQFSTDNGVLSFGVGSAYLPTAADPIEITIIVNAPGYITNSRPLTLTSSSGYSFSMALADMSNLPPGVVMESDTGGQTGAGGVLAPPGIDFGAVGLSNAGASVTIPDGTVLLDEFGNPLVGDVTTTVTYFSNLSDDAQRVFPGGFLVNTIDGSSSTPGAFSTAGFAAFEMMVNGQRVASFEPAVTARIVIPAGTINPDTGQPVVDGETVPIYNYDEDTGEWILEAMGTASGPDVDGNFVVTFETTHFSMWNLDWFDGDVCLESILIRLVGEFTAARVDMRIVATGQYLASGMYVSSADPTIRFLNIPAGMPVELIAYNADQCYTTDLVRIGNVFIDDLCVDGEVSLPVDVPIGPDSQGTSVTITVQAWCEDDPNVFIRPNVPVYMEGPCGWYYAGYMLAGRLTLENLILGTPYTFGVWFQGNFYSYDYLIDQSSYLFEFEIPMEYCP